MARNQVLGDDTVNLLEGTNDADFLKGFAADDVLVGGGGNDLIVGDDGGDDIQGGAGDDRVFGDEGNDTVRGGSGNDTVGGGGGQDKLFGGSGDDILNGNVNRDGSGQAADQFFFSQGGGNDTITDFSQAEGDQLIFNGLGGIDDLGVTDSEGNAVLAASDVTVTLQGVGVAEVESIIGDEDQDTFVFRGDDGADAAVG